MSFEGCELQIARIFCNFPAKLWKRLWKKSERRKCPSKFYVKTMLPKSVRWIWRRAEKMVSTLALTFWNVKTVEISLKGKISVKMLVKNSCVWTKKKCFIKTSMKQLSSSWTLNWRNFGNSMIFWNFDIGTCFDVKIQVFWNFFPTKLLLEIWQVINFSFCTGSCY